MWQGQFRIGRSRVVRTEAEKWRTRKKEKRIETFESYYCQAALVNECRVPKMWNWVHLRQPKSKANWRANDHSRNQKKIALFGEVLASSLQQKKKHCDKKGSQIFGKGRCVNIIQKIQTDLTCCWKTSQLKEIEWVVQLSYYYYHYWCQNSIANLHC